MLKVKQGQEVIIHFKNELPESTTIHWHGMRVPNRADGTPSAQLEVAPDETFDYQFVAKDAGTFWYHPHTNPDNLELQTIDYDRGHNIPTSGPKTLLEIGIEGTATKHAAPAKSWGPAIKLDVPSDVHEHPLELSEDMPKGEGFATFAINGKAFPDVPAIKAQVGKTEVFSIFNNTEMDHPFHLHGMFFRVLDVDGQAPMHDGWKDTVNVPRETTLRFAVHYEDAGTWMYHCHILEHAERGMMGELQLSSSAERQE